MYITTPQVYHPDILQRLKYTILVKQLFLTLQPVHSNADRSNPGQNSYPTSAPLYVLVTLPTHSVPVYGQAQPSSTRGPEVVDRNAQVASYNAFTGAKN
nr:hypothetical protein [Tanacetum cinerariifolium]